LHRDRLIEVILRADLRDHIGIALLAGHDKRRIARQQMLQRKDQDRHEEQCRDQLDDAPREESSAWSVPASRQRRHFSFSPTTRTRPSGICL
jgi:hypothetical protein